MIRYKEVEEEAAAMAVVEVVVMEVVVVVAEVDTESDFKDLLKPTRLTSAIENHYFLHPSYIVIINGSTL